MEFATERTVKAKLNGEEYTCKLVMVPMRKRMTLMGSTESAAVGVMDFFEASVPEVKGPDINGKAITCGKDIIETPGTDALYVQLQTELRNWDPGDEEIKNS